MDRCLLRHTRLRGYEKSLSHLMSTSLRGTNQGPAPALALLSFDPISAILMKGIFLNIAMAWERSDDLVMHDPMQGRSQQQGEEGDLPLHAAACLVRFVRLERKR